MCTDHRRVGVSQLSNKVLYGSGSMQCINVTSQEDSEEAPVIFSPLKINKISHQVWVDDEEIAWTILEFNLICTIVERCGRTQSRAQLLSDVWGYDVAITTRTGDTHIKRLREKLGSAVYRQAYQS